MGESICESQIRPAGLTRFNQDLVMNLPNLGVMPSSRNLEVSLCWVFLQHLAKVLGLPGTDDPVLGSA